MKRVSRELKIAIKLDPRPQYRIAQLADVDPNWLSATMRGMRRIKEDDPRLIAVAKVLGVSERKTLE